MRARRDATTAKSPSGMGSERRRRPRAVSASRLLRQDRPRGRPDTADPRGDSSMTSDGHLAAVADELLNDLRNSRSDMARIVEAVLRDRLPYVVVPIQAIKSWERREPQHWAKVAGWLASRNVKLVEV